MCPITWERCVWFNFNKTFSLTNLWLQDQLIDVFKSVGQVVGFRLVFDRDTGKPRGYGFCEFAGTFNSIRAICKSSTLSDLKFRSLSLSLLQCSALYYVASSHQISCLQNWSSVLNQDHETAASAV